MDSDEKQVLEWVKARIAREEKLEAEVTRLKQELGMARAERDASQEELRAAQVTLAAMRAAFRSAGRFVEGADGTAVFNACEGLLVDWKDAVAYAAKLKKERDEAPESLASKTHATASRVFRQRVVELESQNRELAGQCGRAQAVVQSLGDALGGFVTDVAELEGALNRALKASAPRPTQPPATESTGKSVILGTPNGDGYGT